MQYAFQLLPHANIRYMDSLQKLAKAELQCLLQGLGLRAIPHIELLGGAPFLLFETDPLSDQAIKVLSKLSCLYMAASLEDGLLRPLTFDNPWYLPGDVAEVLKYKGKTSPAFTMMMINCALSASGYLCHPEPITVMDPLSGKGTTLFCALRRGENAIGLEIDKKDVKECSDYFRKYLQLHLYKHQHKLSSLTVPSEKAVPQQSFVFDTDPAAYAKGDGHTLRLLQGDTMLAHRLIKPESVHVMVADLPYGVQHAPQSGTKPMSFDAFMAKALPAWHKLLKKDGALALSFNTFTLDHDKLIHMLERAGFTPLSDSPYHDFSHWVEQAVNRDLVIARPNHK